MAAASPRAAIAARRVAAGEPVSAADLLLVGERALALEAELSASTRRETETESARRFHQSAARGWQARAERAEANAKTLRHQLAQASGQPTKETK